MSGTHDPMAAVGGTDPDAHEVFTKKSEFAPHITITEETFFGHGWQPLTIAFIQALWFLPPGQPFDVPFLVNWLDQIGWKGANGRPVGPNVVRRELGFLREAGYVQSHRLRGEGGQAAGIRYEVSQRRTDQPETGAWIPAPEDFRRSDHVPSMAACGQPPHVVIDEKPSSDHVPPLTTRGTNELPPPHPPEEESSSPYPLTGPTGALPSQRGEEEPGFTPEETAAAERFLQGMERWQAGASTARRCAPRLLRAMRAQGWPALPGQDAGYRALLEAEILKNTGGANSWAKCLPGWVSDLRLYERVRPRPQAGSQQAAIAACSRCDAWGQYEIDGRVVLCRHEPRAAASHASGAPGGESARESSARRPGMCARHQAFAEGDCPQCRIADRQRRGTPQPGPVDGAGLLARYRSA